MDRKESSMSKPEDYLVISSVQEDGRKFRPGDWIERISSALASFDQSQRLHYMESVKPAVVSGEKCLIVACCLEQTNPPAYQFIMDFAHSNKLKILADRRSGERALPCPVPPASK
jgi:hypothetical protein